MKIAYGTYALPEMPLEAAIPMLADLGYDGVEICISRQHTGSMPDELDPARRQKIKGLLQRHGLGVPALFAIESLLQEDDARHRVLLEHMRRVSALARDLELGETPTLAICIGGRSQLWHRQRHAILARLHDYDELARAEGFRLACELHAGAAVDRSERALWVFQTLDSSRVGLHFDIVHCFQAGERVEDSVRQLVPVTLHTHITDARKKADGTCELVVLGDGDLDSTAYMRAMQEAGWDDFITLEVSMAVWGKPGYDLLGTARRSYAALDGAFAAARVART